MSKTKPQSLNERQVSQFLGDARKRAATAEKNLVIDSEAAYQIAYEAMIKGSLAIMLSHGQRPRKQLGHHIAIIEFARENLAGCSQSTFALFDRMRRKRNDAFYDIALISDTEGAGGGADLRGIFVRNRDRYLKQNRRCQRAYRSPAR